MYITLGPDTNSTKTIFVPGLPVPELGTEQAPYIWNPPGAWRHGLSAPELEREVHRRNELGIYHDR